MTAAIQTESLTKFYGRHRALADLDLEITQGEIFGYLGPNGSGKTTTIRLLLDLIRPSAGRAAILGMDVRSASVAIHRRLGYLPAEAAVSSDLNGREYLAYLAHLRGTVDWSYVEALARRFALDLSRRVRDLSTGNRKKVGLIQAFMHRPDVLILDEPTSGLDPLMQEEFHALLLEAKAAGGTALLSSHVLSEVERVADRVAILRAGRLVTVDTIDAIKSRGIRRLEIQFGAPVPAAEFTSLPGVRTIKVDGTRVRLETEGSIDALIKTAARHEVIAITSHEPDLEEVFLEYYRGDEPRA